MSLPENMPSPGMDSPYILRLLFPDRNADRNARALPRPGRFCGVHELWVFTSSVLVNKFDLYILFDVLKYLVRMQADVRSSIIIMIQLRYVRIS